MATAGVVLPAHAEERKCSTMVPITTSWTQVICPNTVNERTVTKYGTHYVAMPTACPASVTAGGGTPPVATYSGGGGSGGGQSGGGGSGGSGGAQTTTLNTEECFSPKAMLKRFLCGTSECSGSSVIMANGTYEFSEEDLRLPARGLAIDWSRSYRSNRIMTINGAGVFAEPADGPLGYGWMNPYLSRIENGDTWVDGEGLYQTFTRDAAGNFTSDLAEGVALVKTASGFELIKRGIGVYQYNAAGKLTSLSDLSGNTVTVIYDAQGKMEQIKDTTGRVVLTFSYNSDGRIGSVIDATNRSISAQED